MAHNTKLNYDGIQLYTKGFASLDSMHFNEELLKEIKWVANN